MTSFKLKEGQKAKGSEIVQVLMHKEPAVCGTKRPVAHAKKSRYITPVTRGLTQEGFLSSDTALK